jgi:hypothetical protein
VHSGQSLAPRPPHQRRPPTLPLTRHHVPAIARPGLWSPAHELVCGAVEFALQAESGHAPTNLATSNPTHGLAKLSPHPRPRASKTSPGRSVFEENAQVQSP